MDDMWSVVAAERGALAADLAGISEQSWDMPSLCTGWTVRDTVAHLSATAEMTPPAFVGKMLGSGFSFSKTVAKEIADKRGGSSAETLERFRGDQHLTTSPPGPKLSWLGETIVHAEDIRRPLAIHRDYPTDAVIGVADFYKGSNTLIGTKSRIAGVTLTATDTDWSYGSGPEAAGPMLSLLMAMTGRKSALDDLDGPGVDLLRSR